MPLGIGANTAIFSVINAVLLQPLPYYHSDRLIDLFSLDPAGGRDGLSMAEFQDLRAQVHSLEDLAGFQSQSVNLTGGERPERVRGAFVSTNFFKVFQLTPVLGRTLVAGEDQPDAAKVVVVNEKLWRERLNGATDLTRAEADPQRRALQRGRGSVVELQKPVRSRGRGLDSDGELPGRDDEA